MAMLRTPPSPSDHRKGDPAAPLVLVEYGDYQCPHCAAAEPVVEALLANFGRDLQLIFRHFPLTQVHPLAETAAQAAEFSGAHGAFWAMHSALFVYQSELSLRAIHVIAGALGLDRGELDRALEAGVYAQKVRDDFIGGVRSGVNGTPTFYVNGLRHDDAPTFEVLCAALLAQLAARPLSSRPVADVSPRPGR
jgi:protein-disulfide isomerase